MTKKYLYFGCLNLPHLTTIWCIQSEIGAMTPAGVFAGFYRCFTQGSFGVPGVYSTFMYIQGFPVITV